MSRIYLPNASQFDVMNENLAKIANAITSGNDISTWAGIQKAVRIGVAPDLFPVGSQLSVNHKVYGTHMYDVVAHNHYKSAHDKNAHTMTLMCHDVLNKLQFDAPEALYYAKDGLAAGTYHFTLNSTYSSWAAGTYQFTLTNLFVTIHFIKNGFLSYLEICHSKISNKENSLDWENVYITVAVI